jgi:hypothetical protein
MENTNLLNRIIDRLNSQLEFTKKNGRFKVISDYKLNDETNTHHFTQSIEYVNPNLKKNFKLLITRFTKDDTIDVLKNQSVDHFKDNCTATTIIEFFIYAAFSRKSDTIKHSDGTPYITVEMKDFLNEGELVEFLNNWYNE